MTMRRTQQTVYSSFSEGNVLVLPLNLFYIFFGPYEENKYKSYVKMGFSVIGRFRDMARGRNIIHTICTE